MDETSALELQLRLHTLLTRAAAAGAESLQDALAPSAHAVSAALHGESLGIWTIRPDARELLLQASSQEEGSPAPLPRVGIGRAHVAALAAAGAGAVFNNPRFEEPLFAPPLNGVERHVTVAPLIVNGRELVGAIAVSSEDALPERMQATLGSVADLIAITVEKQDAAARLREREHGLGTLIGTAPDGIIMMDASSRILAANPSVEQIFGYQPGELIGEDVTILMPERFRARHNTGVRRYRETGQKRISWHGVELAGQRKDGTEFPIEISFGEYAHNGEIVFTGFIRDIGERKRSEARDRRRRRAMQTTAFYVGSALVALQAADLLLPVLPLPGWVFRVLVLLAIAGLPLAVALAWGIDLAGSGGHAARARPAPGERIRPRVPRLAVVVTVGLVVAATVAMSVPLARDGNEAAVIAVLPFDAMQGPAPVQQLAAGLAEDLVTALSAVPGLRVVSRTSVQAAARPGRTVADIARDLRAGYVLEGSVRQAGEQVRVSVRLAHAGSDRHVWAKTYDRMLGDGFTVQSEIANASARALRELLAPPR